MNSPIKYVNDRCSDIGKDFLLVLKFSLYTTPSTDVCESSEVFVVVRPLKRCLPTACVESTEGESEGSGFIVGGLRSRNLGDRPISRRVRQASRLPGRHGREGGREGGKVTGSLARKEHWLSDGLIPNNPRLHPRLNKFSPAFSVRSFFVNPRYSSLAHNSITLEEAVSILYILLKASNVILTALELYLSFFSTDKMFCKKNSTQNVQFSHKMYNIPKNVQFSHQNLPFFQQNVRFSSWIWIFPQDRIFSIDAIICNRAFSEFLLFIGLFALIRARDGILLFNSIIMP